MTGSLLEAAKADAKLYIKEGGFEEDISFSTPLSTFTVQITGFATKHHIVYDTDGTVINAQNAHICVDENQLTALGYPVRVNNEVNLLGHKVTFKDSSGFDKNYVVKEQNPDQTLGLIVCILGDFE